MADIDLMDIIDIVKQAGDLIRNVRIITDIKSKEGPANYVTNYDSAVQSFLINNLSRILPNSHFLAEEDGMTDTKTSDGYVFIIDPIDGTTNFICNFMCSGICVGLSLNGQLLMGVVYNPFREEMFYAQKNKGAFLNGQRLKMKNISLEDSVIDYGGAAPYPELRDFTFDIEKSLSYHTMDLREVGAASVAICYVACGRAAMYAAPKLCAWDYAAAEVIVEEAGGLLSGYDGKPLDLKTGVSVIATTEPGKEEFLSITNDIRKKYRNKELTISNF